MDGSSAGRFLRNSLILITLAPLGPPARADAVDPNGVWVELAPPMRAGCAFIYDPVRNRMILCGGGSRQMWQLVLSDAPRWSVFGATGPSPPSLSGQTAIYDPVRDRMILYPGTNRGEIWALSFSGSPTWSLILPAGTGPAVRKGHTAIYDPVRDRMIVCGGLGNSASEVETWALTFAPVPTWSRITPAGTKPYARSYHAAIYDPVRDQMIITGGTSADETWALSLSAPETWAHWTDVDLEPYDRFGLTAIYDPEGDRMIVFGGHSNYMYSDGGGDYGDLMALDLHEPRAWHTLIPYGPARAYQACVYDPVGKRLVIHGGSRQMLETYALSDTWAASLGPSPAWTGIVSESRPPSPAKDRAAIYDPIRDRLVTYGGSTVSCFDGTEFGSAEDAQGLSLGNEPFWALIGHPLPRDAYFDRHTAVYDPLRDRMVVFGAGMWMLSLAGTPAWSKYIRFGIWPEDRINHSAVYDPFNDRMLVYGGTTSAGAVAELWSWSFSYPSYWTQLYPPGAAPPALAGHAAILDPVRRRMLIIAPPNLWALSLDGPGEWTRLAPTGSQPSVASRGAVYDPVLDRVIVLGSSTSAEGVWALNLSPDPQWQPLSPLGIPPDARLAAPAVYDAARSRVILFGGWAPGPGCSTRFLSDLWALQLPASQPLAVSSAPPSLRVSAAFPNPTLGAASVRLDMPRSALVRVGIHDVGGRLVRLVANRTFEPGSHEIHWDGADLAGRRAPAGIYFATIAVGSDHFVRRIARLR